MSDTPQFSIGPYAAIAPNGSSRYESTALTSCCFVLNSVVIALIVGWSVGPDGCAEGAFDADGIPEGASDSEGALLTDG